MLKDLENLNKQLCVSTSVIFLLVTFLIPLTCFAHVPYFESKIIRDISISQVHYYETSVPGSKEIIILSNGEKLYLMFAVPKIDRLKDFKPRFKILSPEGITVLDFDTKDVEPRIYHEEFGDTYEWIYFEREYDTIAGEYKMIIDYDKPGKFWIAVGKAEKFEIIDILALPITIARVRLFHEEFPVPRWGWILIALGLITISFFRQ
ncbi:MAG: hypothetical protein ACK4R7_05270 [Fervidobacterium sp.]